LIKYLQKKNNNLLLGKTQTNIRNTVKITTKADKEKLDQKAAEFFFCGKFVFKVG
jgi:hypothetical protein